MQAQQRLRRLRPKGEVIPVDGPFIFDLSMVLLVPGIMIVCGLLFMYKPPRDINGAFGYRTAMSMKNQDTWRFAHRVCGKIWFWLGLLLVPLSAVPLLRMSGRDHGTLAAVTICIQFLQLVPFICSIIPTEFALRKAFDKNGRRKNS